MNILNNNSLGKTSVDSQIAELKKSIKALSQRLGSLSSQVDSFSYEFNSETITADSINAPDIETEAITGSNASVTSLTSTSITSDELTTDTADIGTADIDTATMSTLNVTELTTNELDSNSVTANISVTSPLANITSLQAEAITTDSADVVDANIENATLGATISNGDIYFPMEGTKIYGEYLSIDCSNIKIKDGVDFESVRAEHLTTPDLKLEFNEEPVLCSQVIGYNEDGKAIPAKIATDYTLSSKWSENEKHYIFPNDDFAGITIPAKDGAFFNAMSLTPKKKGIRHPESIIRKYIDLITDGAILNGYENIADFYCNKTKKFRDGYSTSYKYNGVYSIMKATSLDYENIEVLHLVYASRMDSVKNEITFKSYFIDNDEGFGENFERSQEVFYEQKGIINYIDPEDVALLKTAFQEDYDNIIGYSEEGICYRWNDTTWEAYTPVAGETNLTLFREVYSTKLKINAASIGKTYGPTFVAKTYSPWNTDPRTTSSGTILGYGTEHHYIDIIDSTVTSEFDTFDKVHKAFTWTSKFINEDALPSNEYMTNWKTSVISTEQNCAYTQDNKRWVWSTENGWQENYDIVTTQSITYFTGSLDENSDIVKYTNYPTVLDSLNRYGKDGEKLQNNYGILMWED